MASRDPGPDRFRNLREARQSGARHDCQCREHAFQFRQEDVGFMTRAAIYARYSSEGQSEASIEDQVRNARRICEEKDWQVVEVYSDRALSGASPLRPGFQKLMTDSRTDKFDVVVAEGLDRLSRD